MDNQNPRLIMVIGLFLVTTGVGLMLLAVLYALAKAILS